MKREDLFLAIGAVDDARLSRSEWSVREPSLTVMEEPKMMKARISKKRLLRNLLVAALIVSTLVVSVLAATGYLLFGGPEEMIAALFGDGTGYDHSEGNIRPDPNGPPTGIIVEPTFDRVPADETVVAEDIAPHVDTVGKSISWEGYTLTVDAVMYDSTTRCGLVTYVLESENSMDWRVQSDGEVWFPGVELVNFSQYGYSYIIQDQSGDSKLAATYYYQLRDPQSSDLVITLSERASRSAEEEQQMIEELKQQLRQEISEEEAIAFQKEYVGDAWPWFEENRTREENIDAAYEYWAYERLEEAAHCPEKIVISENTQSEMPSITLGGGTVVLSPIAVTIKEKQIENLGHSFMGLMKVRFDDGTEYVVQDGYISNYVFNVTDADGNEHTYMFNRVIDVDKVIAVVVDGNVELTLD